MIDIHENQLLKNLACPYTKNNLNLENDGKFIWFKSDNFKYPIRNGVPILFSNNNYDNLNEAFKNSIQDFWNSGWEKRGKENDHYFLYNLTSEEFQNIIQKKYKFEESRGPGIGGLLSNEIKIDSLRNKTSLIIGPGCGLEAIELKFITKTKVIGLDVSFQSAYLTNTLLQNFDNNSDICVQGDARYLPIKSNLIDFVFSHGVLHHSPDIQKSVDEIYRVLRPNGKFCVALYNKYSLEWSKFLLNALLKGKWTKKKLDKYISSETEKAWTTSNKKNPYTKLFSKSECFELFRSFDNLNIRNGNFKTPNNLLLKFLKLLENTTIMSKFGSMIYITGEKKN